MPINTATITRAELKNATTAELVECYNLITEKNIKGFKDRKIAETRLWKVIQSLAPGEEVTIQSHKEKSQKTQSVGKRENYENFIIKILVDKNPKREGTRAFYKFAVLMKMDGKTIGDFRAQEGQHSNLDNEAGWPSGELRWCLKQKFVKVFANKSAQAA